MNILKDSFKDSIKYILTRVFVLVIAGLIFLTICYFLGRKYEKIYTYLGIDRVYAMEYENSKYFSIQNDTRFGTHPGNFVTPQLYVENFVINNPEVAPTEFVAFRMSRFALIFDNETYSTENCTSTLNGTTYTTTCMEYENNNSSHNIYYTLRSSAYYNGNSNSGAACWQTSEYGEMWFICPSFKDKNYYISSIDITLDYLGPEFKYSYKLNGMLTYLNNTSTNILEGLQGQNAPLTNIQDSLTDSNTSSSGSSFTTFINNYTNTIPNNITRIVATPLQTIVNLQGSTCSPLELNIPFINQQLVLPCMSNIYQQYFGAFFTLYQLIISGLVTYWCIIGVLNTVKSLLDANDDKIEVLDL